MPTGAYNLNAWSDNLNDAPVIPNGLQVSTYNQALTTVTIPNTSDNNYLNQVGVLGSSNGRLYFAIGYGGSSASYTGLVTVNLVTGATTSATTLSNSSLGNNEIACLSGNTYGTGQNVALVVSSWNQNATPTETRNNSLYIASWATYGAGTVYAGGNTTLGIFTSDYKKGRASAISAPVTSNLSTGSRWIGVAYNTTAPGTVQVKTYTYSTVAAFTLALNYSANVNWNIQNGVRITTFSPPTSAEHYVVYVGYSTTNLYIGSIYTIGTSTPTQTAVDMGIAWTTRNAMIKTIWDDPGNNIRIAAVLHSDQYIRFVKCTAFGSSFSPTQSQDFLISDMPNTWYRLCSTGIAGLGALVYYVDTEGSFYVKFFSINTSINTITWGKPIQLNVNGVFDMTMMNAEVKYLSFGFSIGIFATNTTANNQFYASILWPVNRSATNIGYQNSYSIAGANITFDNTVKKFGTSSLFISTNQQLQPLPALNNNQPVNSYGIGTGDFTIEFWARVTPLSFTVGQYAGIYNLNTSNAITIENDAVLGYQWSAFLNPLGSVVANTWVHIGIMRSGGNIYGLLDGNVTLLGTSVVNFDTQNYGSNLGGISGGQSIGRYFDEFRFSNVARYSTSGYTVPIAPFSNDVNTLCLLHFNNSIGSGTNSYGAVIDDWGPNYSG